jgi:FkbM family methyltransferase
MAWARVGWAEGLKADWRSLPIAVIRGKHHRFLMRLDRSDWCQRETYYTGRYYEFALLMTLDGLLRPGDCFVDVGANIGMITLHARHLVGADGRIDAFEPNPKCVMAIEEHLRMNDIRNVVVHRCALADSPRSMDLALASEHTGTATLAPVSRAIETVRVDVRVGDDEISSIPRVIKIDVEGFELQVLKGLEKTLQHKPFVITELIESHLKNAGTSIAEVRNFLRARGYKPYGIGLHRTRRFLPVRLALADLDQRDEYEAFTDILWAATELPDDLKRAIRSPPMSSADSKQAN